MLIANSEIAILTGDLKKALSILKAVNSESAYFAEARKIMAEVIYFNFFHLKIYGRIVYFSGIKTRNVRVEGEHDDH